MADQQDDKARPEAGLRARKHRQTRQRIADAGLRLFLKNGFDATTLDAIAEAADISRRTFFHYFESKEAILQTVESGAQDAFRAALAAGAQDAAPLAAVRDALLVMISRYESDDAIAIDRLMRSTEALRARKQSNYERQEQALFAALAEKWPEPERRFALRVVAMMGIGAMRLAAEMWSNEGGCRKLEDYVRDAFANLRPDLAPAGGHKS
jgi:AcrR family transcriptional regulator